MQNTSTFERAFPAGAFAEFKRSLNHRMARLAADSGWDRFVTPVGLFLVLDGANGGDATAADVIKRLALLDVETGRTIDFYFLGWKPVSSGATAAVRFDLAAFDECRQALRAVGVSQFGGYADLILLDAVYVKGAITLRFDEAIRIDLAAAVAKKEIANVGAFLQAVVEHAASLAAETDVPERPTYHLSDRLGLAIARDSLLDWILDKWGKIIGATQLKAVCVRRLGPAVPLRDL